MIYYSGFTKDNDGNMIFQVSDDKDGLSCELIKGYFEREIPENDMIENYIVYACLKDCKYFEVNTSDIYRLYTIGDDCEYCKYHTYDYSTGIIGCILEHLTLDQANENLIERGLMKC